MAASPAYSCNSPTFEFIAEPEPLPPTPPNGYNSDHQYHPSNSTAANHVPHVSSRQSSHPSVHSQHLSSDSEMDYDDPSYYIDGPPSPTWASLTVPGALLNGSIFIIGKSIEFAAPYWPDEEQRRKIWNWCRDRPVFTSWVIMQILFAVIPMLWAAAFAAGLAVMVGLGGVVAVAVGFGVGVCVFLPVFLITLVIATFAWAWTLVLYRVAQVGWAIYARAHAAATAHAKRLSAAKSAAFTHSYGAQYAGEKKKAGAGLKGEKKHAGEGKKVRLGSKKNDSTKADATQKLQQQQQEEGPDDESLVKGPPPPTDSSDTENEGRDDEDEFSPLSASSLDVKVEAGVTGRDKGVEVWGDGPRDEDKVGRDIARSLG